MSSSRANGQDQGNFEAKEDQSFKELLETCNDWLDKTEAASISYLARQRNVSSSSAIVRRHTSDLPNVFPQPEDAIDIKSEFPGGIKEEVKEEVLDSSVEEDASDFPWSRHLVNALERIQAMSAKNTGPKFNFEKIRLALTEPLSKRKKFSQIVHTDRYTKNDFGVTRKQMRLFDTVDSFQVEFLRDEEIKEAIISVYGVDPNASFSDEDSELPHDVSQRE